MNKKTTATPTPTNDVKRRIKKQQQKNSLNSLISIQFVYILIWLCCLQWIQSIANMNAYFSYQCKLFEH